MFFILRFSKIQVAAKIELDKQSTKVDTLLGRSATLYCPATGVPEPSIEWSINDQPFGMN